LLGTRSCSQQETFTNYLSNGSLALQSSFKPAKVFRDQVKKDNSVTSLSFDDRGELLVTAAEDDYLHVYDTRKGK